MTLFDSVSEAITGHDVKDVVPVLIVAAARALVSKAESMDELSTMLIKFCRLVEDEAAGMMEAQAR